jgi:membrane protein
MSGTTAAARETGRFVWVTLNDFFEHRGPGHAAALSFYTFFSLPPLLLLLMVILGLFVEPQEIRGALDAQVRSLVGAAGAEQVMGVLEEVAGDDEGRGSLSVFGALGLAFGATAAFAQLQGALNQVWSVAPDPERGTLRNFLVKRVFSFGLVLSVAFLLLVSLALSAGIAVFGTAISSLLPGGWSEPLLVAIDLAISFATAWLLFATMFQVIPDARVAWSDVWAGSAATAILFVGGKAAIGYWLGATDPGHAYGAAGSLAMLLLWVYYSAMILLLGAEATRVWEQRYGRGVRPATGAVEVITETRRGEAG